MPKKAKSKSQWRLFQALAHGWKPTKKKIGMSAGKAREMVEGQGKKAYKKLPEKVKKAAAEIPQGHYLARVLRAFTEQ